MQQFTFDLQRFDATILTQDSFTSATATTTGVKTGTITVDGENVEVYILDAGEYSIGQLNNSGKIITETITLDKPLVVDSTVTLNLNGTGSSNKTTITNTTTDNDAFSKLGGLIVVRGSGDLTLNGKNLYGSVIDSKTDSAIKIMDSDSSTRPKLTINEKISITGTDYGVNAESAANIEIYGGQITGTNQTGVVQADGTLKVACTSSTGAPIIYGKYACIQFDSTDTSEDGNLNISAGTFETKNDAGTAILIDDDGVVANIKKVSPATAIKIGNKKSTTAFAIKDIEDFGTASATKSIVNVIDTGTSGIIGKGTADTAVAIDNTGGATINIEGGIFSGQLTGTGYNITGGTFKTNPGDNFEEIYLNSDTTKSYIVKDSVPAGVVAMSTDSDGVKHYYTSLSYVVSYASAGDEITLVADIEDALVSIKKNLTINLNGHNITKSPNIDAPSLFIVDAGAEFTIKDDSTGTKGTINDNTNTVTENSYLVAVANGSFTLSDVTLNARQYGVLLPSTADGETATQKSFTMNSGSITATESGVRASGPDSTVTVGGTANFDCRRSWRRWSDYQCYVEKCVC